MDGADICATGVQMFCGPAACFGIRLQMCILTLGTALFALSSDSLQGLRSLMWFVSLKDYGRGIQVHVAIRWLSGVV